MTAASGEFKTETGERNSTGPFNGIVRHKIFVPCVLLSCTCSLNSQWCEKSNGSCN